MNTIYKERKNMENNMEKEVFEVTIERDETPKMCRDTIKFSADCRKYRKRSRDLGDRYDFPVGSTVRLNGKDLYVSEDSPTASCMKCFLVGNEIMDIGIFACSTLCASSICRAGLRADGKNIHYRLKEEVEEHGSL